MKKRSLARIIGEISVFYAVILAVNLFFPDQPGFFNSVFNPYLAFALLAAVYYGRFSGFLSLFISGIMITGIFPFLRELIYPKTFSVNYWSQLWDIAMIPAAVTLAGSFFLGTVRDSLDSQLNRTKGMLKKISRSKGLLNREFRAMKTVNFELEKRVTSHKDSMITLYTRIQEFYTLNLQKALEVLIDIVQNFTGSGICSVWEYQPASKNLTLRLSRGWDPQEQRKAIIPVENTIEGWVVRNNMLFSAKMVTQYDNLKKIDNQRNIYTIPILSGHKIWGVFNIEDIAFEKYNRYTEKNLQMIMALVAPALERSIEYETFAIQEEVNKITNLSYFSQFYIFLEKEISRIKIEKGTLSIIILELKNYTEMLEEYKKDDILAFFAVLSDKLKELSNNKGLVFHYKGDNQLGMLYPNVDFDGSSLFCLNILEMVNKKEWRIQEKKIMPEIILGYASLGESDQSANDLLGGAENLLEMQKI